MEECEADSSEWAVGTGAGEFLNGHIRTPVSGKSHIYNKSKSYKYSKSGSQTPLPNAAG